MQTISVPLFRLNESGLGSQEIISEKALETEEKICWNHYYIRGKRQHMFFCVNHQFQAIWSQKKLFYFFRKKMRIRNTGKNIFFFCKRKPLKTLHFRFWIFTVYLPCLFYETNRQTNRRALGFIRSVTLLFSALKTSSKRLSNFCFTDNWAKTRKYRYAGHRRELKPRNDNFLKRQNSMKFEFIFFGLSKN